MQVLYMAETSHLETAPADLENTLQKSLEKTRELYVYLLYFITEVAQYAETDSRQRRSKNLPSREDLDVNTKIAANLTILAILENPSFRLSVKELKTDQLIDPEMLKRMYNILKETTTYHQYILDPAHDKSKDREIIRVLFSQVLLPNELFCQQDVFLNWSSNFCFVNIRKKNTCGLYRGNHGPW